MFISIHPGNIRTDLGRHMSSFQQALGRMTTYPVSYGIINPLYAGTAPAAGELNGKVSIPVSSFARVNGISFQYLTVWARETLPHKRALDADLGKKVWEWCEEQVKDV